MTKSDAKTQFIVVATLSIAFCFQAFGTLAYCT